MEFPFRAVGTSIHSIRRATTDYVSNQVWLLTIISEVWRYPCLRQHRRYSGRVPFSPLFVFQDSSPEKRVGVLVRRLPPLSGAPVRVDAAPGLRDRRGAVHAGAFLRERRIEFNCTRSEFPRVFVHELFHFVWLRAGNPARHAFEDLLKQEYRTGARGELGWSAEWRKRELTARDIRLRSRRWREYCCESFCDTAAWLYSGVKNHAEFTLGALFRQRRRDWFRKTTASKGLSI